MSAGWRFLFAVSIPVLVLVALPGAVFAQASRLRLVPAEPFRSCDAEIELAVEVDAQVEVFGYQLFLRYPAASVRPVSFEALALAETVWLAGPEGFAPDFPLDCADATDPWRDGQGEDLLAIAGTAFDASEEGVLDPPGAPLLGEGQVLGRLRFEVLESVSIDSLLLGWNDESCGVGLDQVPRLFDELGVSVELEAMPIAPVERIAAGPFEALACERSAKGIRVTWQVPEGLEIEGIRVRREGELIATLDRDARSFEDLEAPAAAALTYAVAPVLAGEVEGCAASCSAGEAVPIFFRGDADLDRRLAIADPVVILRHLFQGGALECEDAADASDDGRLAINDAILVFDFMFRSGVPLPPPGAPTPENLEPGADPTADKLGCALGLAI